MTENKENQEESKVIQMEGMSKMAEKAAFPTETDEIKDEEKAAPCMKIVALNNRTDKKTHFSSINNLGLNWSYHNADQALLIITQLMPGTVKNDKGQEFPNWIPVAHLKDHSIVGFQFGG